MRKSILSVAFDPSTIEELKAVAKTLKYESTGRLVRECVDQHMLQLEKYFKKYPGMATQAYRDFKGIQPTDCKK